MTDCVVGQLLDFSVSPDPIPPRPAQLTTATLHGDGVGSLVDVSEAAADLEVAGIVGAGEANASADHLPMRFSRSFQDLSIEEGRMECVAADNNVLVVSLSPTKDSPLLEDEKFDFDFPLTPNSSKAGEEPACLDDVEDDDEEIFFGSVGFAEQCVSKAVEITEEEQEVLKPLSPLSAEEWVQIFKDAQTIAIQLKHSIQSSSSSSSSSVPEVPILSPTTEAIAAELRQEVFASPHESQRIPTVDKGTVTKSKNSDTVTKNKNTVTKNKNLDTVTKSKKSNTVTKDKEKSSTITKDKSGTGTKSKDKENQPKGKISFAQKRLFGMKPSKEPLEDLAKVLPRVPLKDNVMEFSGKAAQEPVAPGSSKVTKMRRSLQRSSGLQKPGTGLGGSFRSKLKPPTIAAKVPSPQKRRRINSVESLDDETASVASDSSEASVTNVTREPCQSRKRQLPVAGSGLKPPNRRSTGLKPPGLQPPKAHQRSLTFDRTTRSSPRPDTATESTPSEDSKHRDTGGGARGSQLAKPSIKGAMTKLELMRPGALQRKTLTVNRSKLAKPGGGAGPLKAVGASNMERPAVESATAAGPKGLSSRLQASSHNMMTPIKQEKKVQPKRLSGLTTEGSATPRRNSDSDLPTIGTPASAAKERSRRSMLPTPNKTRSSSCTSVASSRTSVSSLGNDEGSPSVGLLVDLSGINEHSTPGALMLPRKPRVQHTPLNKEEIPKKKPSLWSPIQRRKPVSKEEEAFLCTKRSAQIH